MISGPMTSKFVRSGRNSIVISIFSTSSGNGKTVIAINLAAGLAKEGYAVCLMDLDLQFGDVVQYLKLDPDCTIADAQRRMESEPESFDITDYLTEYTHKDLKFSVMAPPKDIYDAYRIDVSMVEELIRRLNWFDFVILDLNAMFSALNLAMLDMSTIINYVGIIDFLPSVKNFKIGYDTLIRFEYEESKIRLVENRSNSQKLIKGSDVERLVGEKFFHRLPNDFASVNRSIQAGAPLMYAAPDSPLTKSFEELAGRYTNRPQSVVSPVQKVEETHPGFVSRFFNMIFH